MFGRKEMGGEDAMCPVSMEGVDGRALVYEEADVLRAHPSAQDDLHFVGAGLVQLHAYGLYVCGRDRFAPGRA